MHNIHTKIQWCRNCYCTVPNIITTAWFCLALVFPFAIRTILILFLIPPTEAQVITYVQQQSTLQYSKRLAEKKLQQLYALCLFVLQYGTKAQYSCLVICSLMLLSV